MNRRNIIPVPEPMQWHVTNRRTNKSPLSLLLNEPPKYVFPTLLLILLPEPLLTQQVKRCLAHEVLLINSRTLHIETD